MLTSTPIRVGVDIFRQQTAISDFGAKTKDDDCVTYLGIVIILWLEGLKG